MVSQFVRNSGRALLLTLVAGAARSAPGEGASLLGSEYDGTVTARLLADVAEIAPGETFRAAVAISMAEGWHTYWENGGDAGLPTTIEWTLPEGFVAGPILWPVPHRYAEEGDIVTFGYADEVILLTEITAGRTIPAGETVSLAARVDWLQCKDICIPGGADLSIRLPLAASTVPAAEPVRRELAAAAASVALSAAAVPNVGVHAFQSLDAIPPAGAADVAVVLSGLGEVLLEHAQFFPRPTGGLWMRDGSFKSDGERLALIVPVEVDANVEPGSVVTLPGVVRVPRPQGDPWLLSFEIPVSVAEAGSAGRPTGAPVFASSGPFLVEELFGSAPAP